MRYGQTKINELQYKLEETYIKPRETKEWKIQERK